MFPDHDSAPYQAKPGARPKTSVAGQASLTKAEHWPEALYRPLVAVNAIGKQNMTTPFATKNRGGRDVAAAKAAVTTARINLGYATVTAPISGRIGRALK